MATAINAPSFSVDEYLLSAFQPDMDYVDGVLEERNVGEFDHGDVQWALLEAINIFTPALGIRARPEVRVQITPTRFRVPDVCVLAANWKRSQIILEAPLLCIEVLSPRDRLADTVQRSRDYLEIGVPETWIVDPRARQITIVTGTETQTLTTGTLKIPRTEAALELPALFAVLDM